MFTGIVTELGRVASVESTTFGKRLRVACATTRQGLAVGDSVSVNGVCLTVVALEASSFTVEAVAETLERSSLGGVGTGDPLDLERPMAADGRFDGHLVQGHVDGVGSIVSIEPEGTARRIRISASESLSPYLVEKGSVTVDGVSLTVTAVAPPQAEDVWFEIVIIPHTLDVTVFGIRAVDDEVNLEVDVIAKYVERMLEARR
jgi:riboflavin synthase